MTGIGSLTVEQFQRRVNRFDQAYVHDWNNWCYSVQYQKNVPAIFGQTLRRWQACRPNRMRRVQSESKHSAPFLEDLIAQADPHIQMLKGFDISAEDSFTSPVCQSLDALWNIFQHLSYHGNARNGLAGVVSISKAVLLLTIGRVGPAFDSRVRGHLQIVTPQTASQWVDSLRLVSADIKIFEARNGCTLLSAAPITCAGLNAGRIYDMALGPGE